MTLTQIKPAGLSKPVDLADNEKIRLGTGNDFEIHHNGNNSLISNSTGDLIIDSGGTSSTVLRSRFDSTVFNNAANNLNQLVLDGGMVRLYESGNEKFRTLSTGAKITGDVESTTGIFERTNNGTSQLKFNNTNETQLKHLSNGQVKFSLIGYNSAFGGAIDAQTSSNYIRILNAADEQAVTCRTNGAVELYYDNSKKFETTSGGATLTGSLIATANVEAQNNMHVGDGKKYLAGNANDLQIYHDGTASFITNTTGGLNLNDTGGYFRVKSDDIKLEAANGEDFLECDANGAVSLYYDSSKKFETTANGVKVNNRFEIRNGVIFDNTANGNNFGFSFNGDGIRPTNGAGTETDNTYDLGHTSIRWNDLWLGGSANIGNYIRTNYNNNGGGAHLYFKNNSQGANFSSHFQTYASSNESGTTQTHIHYYHGGYCELLHQGTSSVRTRSGGGVLFRNGGTTIGTFDPDGLKFGTDTAEVNALDDYEEGTWTPAFNSFTNVGSSEVRQKLYTKIGNTVHLWLEVFGDNDIGWTDSAYIAGTPYSGIHNFPNTLYIPVTLAVMYGGPNYSMDQTAAGRAYYSGYSDKIYLKMGTFSNVRHLWLQLTYRTTG